MYRKVPSQKRFEERDGKVFLVITHVDGSIGSILLDRFGSVVCIVNLYYFLITKFVD